MSVIYKDGFRVTRTFVNSLFILLALLLWYLAYLARPETVSDHATKSVALLFSEILKDVGVVVFSLALVDMLWERFGGEPVQLRVYN